MKTLKALREERVALIARAEAIAEVAKNEARELSNEEAGEVDRILGKGKAGAEGYQAGEVDRIDDQIARAERIEAKVAELAVNKATSERIASQARVIEPINRQRHGQLRGFENREEAFRAGCWIASTFLNHATASQYCRDMGIQNALSTGSGGGSILIPEELERSIVRLVETYGVFRQNCRVVSMSSDTLLVPRRTAGVTSYYVDEVPSSITESSPTVGQAQLVARVLAVRSLMSRDLVEDSIIDLANWLAQEVALAFAQAEDNAGFLGDGTSTYGGIVGAKNALAAGSEYTAATGNTAFSTLDNEDFMGMVGKCPSYALPNAKWYISQAGYWNSMARLQAAAGGNNVADIGGGPVLQYMGFPVVISQVLNSTTTAQTSTEGLCFFGDLNMAATMGIRRGIETQVLQELYAATRQIGVISSQRFDINVHERGTASAAGPLIQLLTPGS